MSTKADVSSSERENEMATLIVADPGPLRDGMEALLASVPRVQVIGKASDIDGAMQVVAGQPVDLLLVDGSFPGHEIRHLMGRNAGAGDRVRTIVFANTTRQARRARELDVDAVFMTGRPPDQFIGMVESLLRDR